MIKKFSCCLIFVTSFFIHQFYQRTCDFQIQLNVANYGIDLSTLNPIDHLVQFLFDRDQQNQLICHVWSLSDGFYVLHCLGVAI